MKKHKVIKLANLPPRFPIYGLLVVYLCMDKWHAPEWLWGVYGFTAGLLIIAWGYAIWTAEEIDIFKNDESSTTP